METTTTSIADKLIDGLRKAAAELEEFRVQAALGKAEARDVYENAKKAFNNYVHEAQIRLADAKYQGQEKVARLKALLETLQMQLALGKAETRDIFEAQTREIGKILNEIEVHIKKNKPADLYQAELQIEIEKFRIKLDILKLQYELKKLGVRDEFETKKKDFSRALSDIKNNLLMKEAKVENAWEHFREGITDTFSYLRKVFVK